LAVGCAAEVSRAPKEKKKKISEVGKNFVKRSSGKGQALPPKRTVPKKDRSVSGAIAPKAFRIQPVRISIMILLREP
jgi:hypothetical protein